MNDPFGIETVSIENGEERFSFIGMLGTVVVTVVVYMEKGENIRRIISFRKASAKERRLYENGV